MKFEQYLEEQFLEVGRNSPVSKVLYGLKKQGKVPYITFEIVNGQVKLAKLVMGSISYYFHGTKDKDGNNLEVIREDCGQKDCHGVFTKLPFDGYEMSIQEDYPSFEEGLTE